MFGYVESVNPGMEAKSIRIFLLETSVLYKPMHNIYCIVFQVVVFQTYENETENPIEAKYVFPLDDTAAVCGFEAFIKGKHIIGEVS